MRIIKKLIQLFTSSSSRGGSTRSRRSTRSSGSSGKGLLKKLLS